MKPLYESQIRNFVERYNEGKRYLQDSFYSIQLKEIFDHYLEVCEHFDKFEEIVEVIKRFDNLQHFKEITKNKTIEQEAYAYHLMMELIKIVK